MADRLLSADYSGHLRLSVVQYSGAQQQRVEVSFTSRVEDVLTRLQSVRFMDSATDLPAALGFLTSTVQREGRPGVPKKVVIFTDGRSVSTAQADIPRAAAAALGQNMQVFALTVGEIVNETGVCQLVTGLASGYSYEAVDRRVHRLAHYTDLASRVVMQSLAKKLVKA